MSRTRKRKVFECIEYLSVEAPLNKVDYLEDKQSRYIREYVRDKEYMIVGTERRHGFSKGEVNKQWAKIVDLIHKKRVQGVVVANMAAVASDLPDAFYKIGQVIEAGGIVVSVDDGLLSLSIGGFEYGSKKEEKSL